MAVNHEWLPELTAQLPRHAGVIDGLRQAVLASDLWRWLSVSCSLGSGRGDEHSDIDAGIGYAQELDAAELERSGLELVTGASDVADVLVHRMDGWPEDTLRFAAEYADGTQLDLVAFPAKPSRGAVDGEVVVVDKDDDLTEPRRPRVYGPPDERLAREWTMLGWWAVSDIAKYIRRGSLFEAAARIDTVREHSLRLFAAASDIPYPIFGLTSLLDYPPY